MLYALTEKAEPVEVDQKGLIDKILARYSSKFAVLRELLQNADDASATKVEIHFKTNSENKISSWVISNNGKTFTPEDWQRLKTIASGNPESGKVGAFGVGFYSVFSVTSAPQIQSGDDARVIYRGLDDDKLYIAPLRHSIDIDPWTTVFTLPVEANAQLPGQTSELGRFLEASLPFMANITSVTLLIDSTTILSLQKHVNPNPVKVPVHNKFKPSDETMFKMIVERVEQQAVRVHVKAQPSLYDQVTPSKPDYDQDVTLWTASIRAIPTKASKSALKKITKKSVPELSKIRIAINGRNDHNSYSISPSWETPQAIIPGVDGSNGHIYIGHATAQTTGFEGHVSGHFIPTVERELLDLENNYVKSWNEQLFYRVGCLARTIYDYKLDLMKTGEASFESNHYQFVRLLQFFTFGVSHPHPRVSFLIHKAFFTCMPQPDNILLLTQHGVLPAKSVRGYDPGCRGFLKKLTMLGEAISNMINQMMGPWAVDLLRSISFDDILTELRSGPLEEDQMAACFNWVLSKDVIRSEDNRKQFVNAARFKHGARVIALDHIKSILDVQTAPSILPQSPLPASTLPYQISGAVHRTSDLKLLLGTADLSVSQWLQHTYTPSTDDNTLFQNILISLAQHWQDLGKEQEKIKQTLGATSCIPTPKGIYLPGNAYVSPKMASVFPNLPVINLADWEAASSSLEAEVTNFLLDIGVRNKIDLKLLPSYIKSWDNHKLLRYLLEHDPTEDEKELLRQMPLFIAASPSRSENHEKPERFKASDLHMPTDEILQMDLKIAAWPDCIEWDVHSQEVRFFQTLGMREDPELGTLIERASEAKYNPIAFPYLMDLLSRRIKDKQGPPSLDQYMELRFVPIEGLNHGDLELATVMGVYRDPGCTILKLLPIAEKYRSNQAALDFLQVRTYPKPEDLIVALEKVSPGIEDASECFKYLLKAGSLEPSLYSGRLRDLPFVPVERDGMECKVKASECYLQKNSGSPHYEKLFPFVDFGNGNHFLQRCGAKDMPNQEEIATKLFQEPKLFFEALGKSKTNYKQELANISTLPKETRPVLDGNKLALLGYDYQSHTRANHDANTMDDTTLEFLSSKQILIMDNDLIASAFPNDRIYYAPRALEDLYKAVKCKTISSVVSEEYTTPEMCVSDPGGVCVELRTLILERLPLYIPLKTPHRGLLNDMKKPGNTFQVKLYSRIDLTRTLHYSTLITRKLTVQAGHAVIRPPDSQSESRSYILKVSETDLDKMDYFQIAYCVLRFFYKNPTSHACCIVMMLLTSSLEQLRQRGYIFTTELLRSDLEISSSPGSSTNKSTTPNSELSRVTGEEAGIAGWKKWLLMGLTQNLSTTPTARDIDALMNQAITAYTNYNMLHPGGQKGSLIKEKAGKYCSGQSYNVALEPLCEAWEDLDLGIDVYVGNWKNSLNRYDSTLKFFEDKRPIILAFFKDVIQPLQKIYGFPLKSVRIFWDPTCPQIAALNLQTQIYFNLDIFEKKHWKGNRSICLVAWFEYMSHELSHNVCPYHDAAFDIVSSHIRQKYIFKLFAPNTLLV